MNLLEAWEYLQQNRDATLYVKFKETTGRYGEDEVEYIETLSIFRDHPYTAYHSGNYPSYFDQDDEGMGQLYDRHLTGTYYTTPDCK